MSNLTITLLAAIGIVFVLQLIFPVFTDAFDFNPALALTQPWRFITSIFLHASMLHIFFNGYALLMFGSLLERKVSGLEYLIVYFGAGFVGGIFYYMTYVLGIIPAIPALGASGAIYGIMGATAILLPEVRLFMLLFPMSIRQAAVVWIVLEFLGTFDISSGIASAAHLGGLLFGLVCGWYILRQRKHEAPEPMWTGSA
jgi:uncharacterized protein